MAVTGATGLIGSALVDSFLQEGHEVRRLVRRTPGEGEVEWDPAGGRIDRAGLEGVDVVVHLAAESIDGRWTEAKKRRIRDSRLQGTALLADTLASLQRPPDVLVSASAVGIYGAARGEERLTEESSPGDDFMGRLGLEWERAAEPATNVGIRVVHPRTAMVLARHGGALPRMLPPFQLGLGGRLGNGRQWMSWITLVDVVRAIRFAIDHEAFRGPFNAVAPEPVTNSTFTQELGRALNRPTLTFVPAAALRLALGEMADGTVLASQRALPARLLNAGFTFEHPTIDVALASIFGDRR